MPEASLTGQIARAPRPSRCATPRLRCVFPGRRVRL